MSDLHTPMTLEELDEAVMNDNKNIANILERLAALEKAVSILSNTLHVIDATSLLSLYSLIKTDNLRQPNFTNNQDIIDSGCSDAINRMMKTVMKVNAAESKLSKEKDNGKEDIAQGR